MRPKVYASNGRLGLWTFHAEGTARSQPRPIVPIFRAHPWVRAGTVAWLKGTGADPAKLNVNGGAIARGKRWGLQTMCEGGGIANATIVEAV